MDRKQPVLCGLVGGIGLPARLVRDPERTPRPALADPALAGGQMARVRLPERRAVSRVCRDGYRVTPEPTT